MPRHRNVDIELMTAYFRDFCQVLMKQRRSEVVCRPGGGAQETLDYPQLGDLLEVSMHAHAWRAMYVQDTLARQEEAG